jgi:hypothetical protein
MAVHNELSFVLAYFQCGAHKGEVRASAFESWLAVLFSVAFVCALFFHYQIWGGC